MPACPQCITDVPAPPHAVQYGLGGEGGRISYQPPMHGSECPNCRTPLRKAVDSPAWRIDRNKIRQREAAGMVSRPDNIVAPKHYSGGAAIAGEENTPARGAHNAGAACSPNT